MKDYFNMNKILDFCSYVVFFFLGNLYFMILNLPIVFFLFFIGFSSIKDFPLFFSLSLIPLGPAFTALSFSCSKAIKNDNLRITRNFFKSYKLNFLQTIIISTTYAFFFLLIWTNISFFTGSFIGYFILPSSYILFILLFLSSIYIYPIVSRFQIKTLSAFKVSFYLTITKFKINLGNIIILLFSLLLIEIKPSYSVLIVASVTVYLLMFFLNKTLKTLECYSQNFDIDKSI